MTLVDIFFPGGHEPRSTSDWVILVVTGVFAVFLCSFMLLFALSLLVGVIALLQQVVGF
jgi:succinate dehydrogenase hydrophobic anchor subunit